MKRSKQTKKALTGSVLALVLCFVMLLGTTFAWFTDTASTKVNAIQSGTLDIVLEKATEFDDDGNPIKWEEVKADEELSFAKASNAPTNEAVLWEPGCTYQLPTLRVRNNGNLALKYKVVFTPVVAKAGDEKLAEVLYVVENGDETTVTLKDVFAFTPAEGSDAGILNGNLKPGDTSEDYTIALYMDENAGNAYQGMCIESVYVTILATQDTVEYDSSTNMYDEKAEYAESVTTADGLKTALKNNTTGAISLSNDIAMTEENSSHSSFCVTSINSDLVIDANGQTVTNNTNDNSGGYNLMFAIMDKANVTFTGDGTFVNSSGASSSGLIYAYGNSVVTVESGTYELEKNGSAVWATDNATVYIKGGTFINKNEENKTSIYAISDLIYATRRAKIYISGGFFDFNMSGARILNLKDDSTTTAKIEVIGGTFVNFNPATDNSEGEGHSWVADGYKVTSTTQDNGDIWYTVVPA